MGFFGQNREGAEAGYAVGYMYEFGEGVVQHHSQAVTGYRRVAEQGHYWARCSLGIYSSA
jgi:TPR repeat protein